MIITFSQHSYCNNFVLHILDVQSCKYASFKNPMPHLTSLSTKTFLSRELQLFVMHTYIKKHITNTHYCNISKIPKIPRAKYLKNCSMYKFCAKEKLWHPKGDAQIIPNINNFQDSRHIQDQKSLFETIFRPKSKYISLLLCTYISSLLK